MTLGYRATNAYEALSELQASLAISRADGSRVMQCALGPRFCSLLTSARYFQAASPSSEKYN
jgi:hypothetical protein